MNYWQVISMFLMGFALGLYIGAKYVTKPTNNYTFGKVKAKGEGNQVTSEIKPQVTEIPQQKERKGLLKIFKKRIK